MNIPHAYLPGYEEARALDPDRASRYIAHTTIGDSEMDAVVEELSALAPGEGRRFIEAFMDNEDESIKRDAPPLLQELFKEIESPPDWVDFNAFRPGIRMFHRNSQLVLGAFVGGALVEGFSTNISKSFFITGRVRERGVRRLRQNNRHMIEIFMPSGLEREGDGWKLSVRIRLVHAQVRRLLKNSIDWDNEEWGVPISAAHVGYSIAAFSARLLMHMESLGAKFSDEERESFLAVWCYSGYLMGIPETILYQDEEDALRLFDIGTVCEPAPEAEAVVMAHALVNSAPLVIGITEPPERRKLSRYVFGISRALIGQTMADQLKYPKGITFGVLEWFRMQARLNRVMGRFMPKTANSNFSNFTSLLQASAFDEAGISYRLPDHVYAEESSEW
jgi:hypothetical protein